MECELMRIALYTIYNAFRAAFSSGITLSFYAHTKVLTFVEINDPTEKIKPFLPFIFDIYGIQYTFRVRIRNI